MASQKVNYIKHLKAVNQKFFDDNTLNASHISMYNALFQLWNNCGFQKDLSVNRNDVMNLSKIGSVNTYLKCLKDLDKSKFLKYKPSHNPLKGSIINLFTFDTSTDIVENKYSTSTDTTSGTSTDTLYKLLNLKTIKLLNDNYKIVNSNLESWINGDSNHTVFYFDVHYLKEERIITSLKENLKLTDEKFMEYYNEFKINYLEPLNVDEYKDAKTHFVNWIKIEIKKKPKEETFEERLERKQEAFRTQGLG